MKHAYLILAHNDFAILEYLIAAIDDPRNDIYIHFDKKVRHLPKILTNHSKLFVIENRVDVRWGDVSVVQGEFALFGAAFSQGPYAYYHLLSGVDMPLKSQNKIHDFFQLHQGKEFIGFSQGDIAQQIDLKVNRYHLFPRSFRNTGVVVAFMVKALRYSALRLQFILNIRRNKKVQFRKGTQWVSITHEFLSLVLSHKAEVLKQYAYTFCSDEIFLQTLCWNSPFRNRVFDITDEGRGCQRMIGWQDNVLVDWEEKDLDRLLDANAMFARKFNSKHIGVFKKLYRNLR